MGLFFCFLTEGSLFYFNSLILLIRRIHKINLVHSTFVAIMGSNASYSVETCETIGLDSKTFLGFFRSWSSGVVLFLSLGKFSVSHASTTLFYRSATRKDRILFVHLSINLVHKTISKQ